jgi:hypothetical protein
MISRLCAPGRSGRSTSGNDSEVRLSAHASELQGLCPVEVAIDTDYRSAAEGPDACLVHLDFCAAALAASDHPIPDHHLITGVDEFLRVNPEVIEHLLTPLEGGAQASVAVKDLSVGELPGLVHLNVRVDILQDRFPVSLLERLEGPPEGVDVLLRHQASEYPAIWLLPSRRHPIRLRISNFAGCPCAPIQPCERSMLSAPASDGEEEPGERPAPPMRDREQRRRRQSLADSAPARRSRSRASNASSWRTPNSSTPSGIKRKFRHNWAIPESAVTRSQRDSPFVR